MKLIIKGGKLIDGTDNPPVEQTTIVVEDDKIVDIVKNESNKFIINREDKIINATGKVILPGLINAHVHLYDNPLEVPSYERGTLSLLRAVIRCKEILDNGITTVRDTGAKDYGIISLKEAINQEIIVGPRIIACGKAIAMTGGHDAGTTITVDGPIEMRKAVRKQLAEGCDFIKVFVTGGFGKTGERLDLCELSLDEIKSGVETAHASGKRVAAHAYGNKGIRSATQAGVDSIEHATFLDEDVISQIINAGIFLVPTLSNTYQVVAVGPHKGLNKYLVESANRVFPVMLNQFKNAYDAGVKLAAGTDGGSWFNPQHDIVTELKLRGETGVPNLELIRMATKIAAECLGLDHEIGTLEIGKVADIIIVEGDPSINIENLRNIWLVMKRGKVCKQGIN